MTERLVVIGAPSSAGAYGPGQEQAPRALRDAGLIDLLRGRGVDVEDAGDTETIRMRDDPDNPRARNADLVAQTAGSVAAKVGDALAVDGSKVLVLGGDCTVEVGTVAGAATAPGTLGLVYVDHDADLNTPQSTDDGALDWMGVAHLLAVDGTVASLAGVGPRVPLLDPEQLLLFGQVEPTSFERGVIDERGIAWVHHDEVRDDPVGAASRVVKGWAAQFDRLLVHLDIDVVDFADAPLAENTRRNVALKLDTVMAALEVLVAAPNFCGLTVCEVNPNHGEPDGSTVQDLTSRLVRILAGAFGDGPSR
ncbi:arginase family protein [Nocardioides campestrisoli]|uniref:arginase family protein n=1 Tax=Nocardioides campestrisoli TaxID=2736757 RepID=UPI00163DB0DA|nr:arginase family protein [Nocardioides campestrisoli]